MEDNKLMDLLKEGYEIINDFGSWHNELFLLHPVTEKALGPDPGDRRIAMGFIESGIVEEIASHEYGFNTYKKTYRLKQ